MRRTTTIVHARSRRAAWLVVALAMASASLRCGAPSRFALRPPLLREGDDRPLRHAPVPNAESDVANALDVILLRPIAHSMLFEQVGEARNVNSLDEVPDSTWFTNRRVLASELERGACTDAGPTPPFTVRSSKVGGTTPGFMVRDARGQGYVLKLDYHVAGEREITTAADAIVSRLYWAAGFNVPCNDVVDVDPGDMRVTDASVEALPTGRRVRLTGVRLQQMLALGTPGPHGTIRMLASRFIDGQPVGTWHTEGTRSDDSNDVVPHEDRRELRGERLMAAWVNHWDSRGPNTFDSFAPARGGGGYIVHYFLDFSDSLGGTPNRRPRPEPRAGYTTVSSASRIATDTIGFGFVREPWDELRVDPRYPELGFFGVEHFDPMGFSPQTPQVRWARAQPADLGWMARQIARIGLEHIRVAVHAGRLTDPGEEARLVEILMGRRERILRDAFARASPLADVAMRDGDTFCATDLGVDTGLVSADAIEYRFVFREGARLEPRGRVAAIERGANARLCIHLPAHFAPDRARIDAAERYATLDVVRTDGAVQTMLRAHFYDLGARRGYVLVGIERLPEARP